MSKLRIDFGPRQRTVTHYVGWLLLSVAAGLVVYEAWCYGDYFQERRALRAELDRAKAKGTPPIQSVDMALTTDGMNRTLQAMRHINAPWDRLFAGVEAAMDGQTTLLGMEPDLDRQEIRFRVEARDFDSMLQWLRRIDAVAGLQGGYLDTHQILPQDRQNSVRFTAVIPWATLPKLPGSRAAAEPRR